MSQPLPRRFLAVVLAAGGSLIATAAPALAAPYRNTLRLEGVTFQVEAKGEGSTQELTVQAERDGKPLPVQKLTVDAKVVGAEVKDLNGDGQPELFVYGQSAGSGSYGSVWAWSVSRRGSLQPIRLGAMSSKDSTGYRGHDRFAVVRNSLVRSFPIYLPGDPNARPTGGTRQVTYRLVSDQGTLQLQPQSTAQSAPRN